MTINDAFLRNAAGFCEALALKAGRAVMAYYGKASQPDIKADNSPVTAADQAAEDIILAGLRQKFPAVPVVSEEDVSQQGAPEAVGGRFFLVDPLDGTKEFINQRSEFTVNIALIEGGAPVLGVVYAPACKQLYTGYGQTAEAVMVEDFKPAARRAISVNQGQRPPVAVASRSHRDAQTDAFLQEKASSARVFIGSSLKFCLIARGDADIYPRFGRTMQWDTAAGDGVLRAAGGCTQRLDGAPLAYGHTGRSGADAFENPHFVAYSRSFAR